VPDPDDPIAEPTLKKMFIGATSPTLGGDKVLNVQDPSADKGANIQFFKYFHHIIQKKY